MSLGHVARRGMASASVGLAMAMSGFNAAVPPIGGEATPTFERSLSTYRDGLGRRKSNKQHPKHNANRDARSRKMFNAKVRSTHSDREDPRDDKYLHSHARQMRALRRVMANRPEV